MSRKEISYGISLAKQRAVMCLAAERQKVMEETTAAIRELADSFGENMLPPVPGGMWDFKQNEEGKLDLVYIYEEAEVEEKVN